MFTTTALIVCGDVIAAPCPHCGAVVLVGAGEAGPGFESPGALPAGTGRCRGCRQQLAAASIHVPDDCRQRFAGHVLAGSAGAGFDRAQGE